MLILFPYSYGSHIVLTRRDNTWRDMTLFMPKETYSSLNLKFQTMNYSWTLIPKFFELEIP